MIPRTSAATAALALVVGAPLAQETADATRPLRLGVFFWHDSPNDVAALRGIEAALRGMDRPHDLLVRRADEDPAHGAELLAELRAADIDLLFPLGTEASLLAAEHVHDVPIVFTAVTNPVESRVVKGWDGSGRNLAGNSNWIPPETVLHVFQLAIPDLRRLGVIRTETGVVSAAELRQMRGFLAKPEAPRIELVEHVVPADGDVAAGVDALAARRVDAIWIPIDIRVYESTRQIFTRACAAGVPLVSSSLRGVRRGAVAGVVVDYELLGSAAVALALRVLDEGVDPGTLPVGALQSYRVVVNLEAARRCNHGLPLSALAVADVLLETVEPEGGGVDGQK